jgi:DnaJ family protein A protein 2
MSGLRWGRQEGSGKGSVSQVLSTPLLYDTNGRVLSCKKCKGSKITKQKTKLKLDIEPGSIDGDRIVLTGEGDAVVSFAGHEPAKICTHSQHQPNSPPGDVILRLRVHSHHSFHAGPSGSRDLYYTASITLSESLLGFQRVLFYHLDGRGIKVDCPAGERIIKHGDTFFLKGEGMPKNAGTGRRAGDLYIKFQVEMPDLEWVKRQQVPDAGSQVNTTPAIPERR